MSALNDTSGSVEMSLTWLTEICNQYLSIEEATQIHQQFQSDSFLPNKQVMWSGMLQTTAQKWADSHSMQTLTTAMGSLKMSEHPSCPRNSKSEKGWSKYIKGVSVLFAYYITKGETVTVLSPPPPDRFHPLGGTNYQLIEEPILKGLYGNVAVDRIDIIHPSIKVAADFRYQIWPIDESFLWTKEYNDVTISPPCWRKVKLHSSPNHLALLQHARGDAGISASNFEISAAEATLKTILTVKAQVKIAQVAKSTGIINTMTSTKHGKQMKIVKASDMVKTKTPVTTQSKTQTAKPKKSTKSKKAVKPRNAAKTKKKGKKATKKDIPAAPINTVGRQLRLELKRALQNSLVFTRLRK